MKSIDIVFPVYYGNLHEIQPCVDIVVPFFTEKLKNYSWKVVFAINGKDPEPIMQLVDTIHAQCPEVSYTYTPQAGKGSGVIHAWLESAADIIMYMDVDLATDIGNFMMLVEGIENGYDLCIGSRYHPDSKVERSLKRKVVSIIYHRAFMKLVLGARAYTDAQCGYKALDGKKAPQLLPLIRNKNWFFESEMLYIAERKKMKIKEIPVQWKESRFSGLTLYKAIWEFIRSSISMRFRRI